MVARVLNERLMITGQGNRANSWGGDKFLRVAHANLRSNNPCGRWLYEKGLHAAKRYQERQSTAESSHMEGNEDASSLFWTYTPRERICRLKREHS